MERVVERELLDDLAFDDPEALRSRQDLRLLNLLMGNHRRIAATARKVIRAGDRLLELGAGHGELTKRLRNVFTTTKQIDALDLCPPPEHWPAECQWHRIDATSFSGFQSYDGVVANLLLHQFPDSQLSALGKRIADGPRFIIAAEPTRRQRHLLQLRAIGSVALGRVTRHDGALSIRAGFRGEELPQLLGLDSQHWRWSCKEHFFGQYFMLAERIG